MRYLPLIPILLLLAAPASAAETKYSTWKNPDAAKVAASGAGTTAQLIKELKALIDQGEKARAADPLFLRDLRGLADKYSAPASAPVSTTTSAPVSTSTSTSARRQVLFDDFSDGNYTANPVWTVLGGTFQIEPNWGLRSARAPQRFQAGQQSAGQSGQSGSGDPGRDAVIGILGAILKQDGDGQAAPPPAPTTAPAATRISTPAVIGNAFSISLALTSWHAHVAGQGDVRFEFGPYLEGRGGGGYRLSYTSGDPLRLIRTGARGTSVIDSSKQRFMLEDKKLHTLTWSRDVNGLMAVKLDGVQVIHATDRNIRSAFRGIILDNQGGDFIVRRVSVSGGG